MRILKVLVLLLTFSGVFVSYADDGIALMKSGCLNPGAHHNQLPPNDIKIFCIDERIEWVPAGHDDATIFNKRTVCSNAMTNKPNIKAPKVCEPCNWPGSDYECGGYKEVCKTVQMTFSVTCEQVLKMVSINKFCQEKVFAEVQASNEELLSVKETGKSFNTCTQKIYMNGKVTEEQPPTAFVNK